MPTLLLALTAASATPVPMTSFAQAAAGCGSNLTDGGTVCGGGAAGSGPDSATGAVPTEPASAPAGLLPQSTVGNPIDLMTGNKRQAENDFALPGAALVFNRTYNSLNADHDVGLGHSWHHSYAVTLLDADGGARELIQGNGRRLRFRGSFLVEIDWPDQRHLPMFYRQRRLTSATTSRGCAIRTGRAESTATRRVSRGGRTA